MKLSFILCVILFSLPLCAVMNFGELPVFALPENTQEDSPCNQTVFGKKEIHTFEQPSLSDVLKRMPGVIVTPGSGSVASPQMFYIRGMPHRYSQIIYDGMSLNDASSLDGSFFGDFLSTDRLMSVKVKRGGEFYKGFGGGLGGSILLSSDRPKAGLSAMALNEVGSKWSERHYARFSYGHEKADFLLDGAFRARRGYKDLIDHHKSLIHENMKMPSYGIKGALYPSERLEVHIQQMETHGSSNLMNKGGWLFDHMNKSLALNQARILYHALEEQNWDHEVMAYGAQHDLIYSRPRKANFKGRSSSLKYDSVYKKKSMSFSYGGSFLFERGEGHSFDDFKKRRDKKNVYGNIKQKINDRLSFRVGLLHQKTAHFSPFTSFSGSIFFRTQCLGNALFSSISKSGKEPSFFYLYDPRCGNPHLKLEKNISWDAGLKQEIGSKFFFKFAYYRHYARDAINFSFDTWKYNQIARLLSHGLEGECSCALSENFNLKLSHTLSMADQKLVTLPKHSGFLEGRYNISDKWSLSALCHHQSRIRYAFRKVKEFYGTDLIMKYCPYQHFTFYVRSDNIFNRKYRGWLGTVDASRRIFIGIKVG